MMLRNWRQFYEPLLSLSKPVKAISGATGIVEFLGVAVGYGPFKSMFGLFPGMLGLVSIIIGIAITAEFVKSATFIRLKRILINLTVTSVVLFLLSYNLYLPISEPWLEGKIVTITRWILTQAAFMGFSLCIGSILSVWNRIINLSENST